MEKGIIVKQQELYEEKDRSVSFNTLEEVGDSLYEDRMLASSCQQCGDTGRCNQVLPFQIQTQDDLTVQRIIHFEDKRIIHLEDASEHWPRVVNITMSSDLNIIYTAGSPVDFSLNIKSRKCSNQSLKLYRKTRTANIQGKFPVQYALPFRPKKIEVSPVGKWIGDSWKDKEENVFKGSLLIQLGDQNSSTISEKASSINTEESNPLELPDPPSVIHCVPPHSPREYARQPRKWMSGSNIPDQRPFPFTSTRLLRSDLSETTPISKGLLHYFWKNGIPYFVFFAVQENSVLSTNLSRLNASDAGGTNYMYIFNYGTSCLAEDHDNKPFHIVGKMKVSSFLSFNSNGSKNIEHEFVLFGVADEQKKVAQNSTLNYEKTKVLSKHMGNVFKTNNLNQKKAAQKYSEMNLDLENCSWEYSMHPSLELAAIVIKDLQTDNRKIRTISGWGLKFLENRAFLDHSLDSSTSEICDTNERKYARSINVLIPAGLHGGLETGTGRPSTLIERWSGASCDCGGWDLGCPLFVLKNQVDHQKEISPDASAGVCSITDLCMEGSGRQEPTLRMVSLQEGLYVVYFQSNLSSLQAFSTGVASIHTQMKSLFPDCDL